MQLEKRIFILMGEDDDDDAFLLNQRLTLKGIRSRVRCFKNGQQIIDYLSFSLGDPSFPRPNLVLLDIKMPMKNGFEVLEWINAQEELHGLSVAFLTGSNHPKDVERAAALGPVSIFHKADDMPQVIELIQSLECKACGWI